MSDSISTNKESFECALIELHSSVDGMVGIIDQSIISQIEDVIDEYSQHYKADIEYTMEEVGKITAEYNLTMERLISARNLIAELQAKISGSILNKEKA